MTDDIFDIIPEHYTVQHILDNFDFYKVERYMKEVNWTWISTRGMMPPTVYELKNTAKRLLEEARACKKENMYIATGGFTVMKSYGALHLFFVIEESSDDYDEYKYYD